MIFREKHEKRREHIVLLVVQSRQLRVVRFQYGGERTRILDQLSVESKLGQVFRRWTGREGEQLEAGRAIVSLDNATVARTRGPEPEPWRKVGAYQADGKLRRA